MDGECRKDAEGRSVVLVFREPVPWEAVSALTYTPRNTLYSLGNKSLLVFFEAEARGAAEGARARDLPLRDLAENPWKGFAHDDLEDLCFRLALDYALRLAEDIAWDERERMKGERAGWGRGRNTGMPFYHRIYERTTTGFRERYDVALTVFSTVDVAVERDPRGRKPVFDAGKILSALPASGESPKGDEEDRGRPRPGHDPQRGQQQKTPPATPTTTTSGGWAGKHSTRRSPPAGSARPCTRRRTGERPRSFTVDGSARTKAHTPGERIVAGRRTLTHGSLPYQAATGQRDEPRQGDGRPLRAERRRRAPRENPGGNQRASTAPTGKNIEASRGEGPQVQHKAQEAPRERLQGGPLQEVQGGVRPRGVPPQEAGGAHLRQHGGEVGEDDPPQEQGDVRQAPQARGSPPQHPAQRVPPGCAEPLHPHRKAAARGDQPAGLHGTRPRRPPVRNRKSFLT